MRVTGFLKFERKLNNAQFDDSTAEGVGLRVSEEYHSDAEAERHARQRMEDLAAAYGSGWLQFELRPSGSPVGLYDEYPSEREGSEQGRSDTPSERQGYVRYDPSRERAWAERYHMERRQIEGNGGLGPDVPDEAYEPQPRSAFDDVYRQCLDYALTTYDRMVFSSSDQEGE